MTLTTSMSAKKAEQIAAEQRASYENEGYLVFPSLLSVGELNVLQKALAEVLREADGLTETNERFSVTPTGNGGFAVSRDGAFTSQLEDKAVVEDPTRWLKVPVPAGGMELHHCNMLHSSSANHGSRPRSAMVIQYRAADNVALGGNMTNAGFGLQVRGANPYSVRMIGGTFKLPGKIEDPLQRDG
jgi:hypothetical protein